MASMSMRLISRWRQGLKRSDQSRMEMAGFFEWASMPITNRGSSRVARSIYAMTGSSRPYAASNATCLRSFTRQLCSSSSRPDL